MLKEILTHGWKCWGFNKGFYVAGSLKFRITIDIIMTITLIVQMGYMLVGDLAHEITGTITIVLWIVHNILHCRWYAALGMSKYPPGRIIDTIISLLLVIAVAGIIVSAVILSSYVFSFLGIERGMSFARGLHMVSVYWCFILSSLHLGLHWSRMLKIVKKKLKPESSRLRDGVLRIVLTAVSCFGLYSFIKQQLVSYMFLRTMFVFFDFDQSVLSFFFEYISIMVFFAAAAYYISALFTKNRLKKKTAAGVNL